MRIACGGVILCAMLVEGALTGGESTRFVEEDARLLYAVFKETKSPPITAVGPRLFRINEPDGTLGLLFDGQRITFNNETYWAAFYVNIPSVETLNIENLAHPAGVVMGRPRPPPTPDARKMKW